MNTSFNKFSPLSLISSLQVDIHSLVAGLVRGTEFSTITRCRKAFTGLLYNLDKAAGKILFYGNDKFTTTDRQQLIKGSKPTKPILMPGSFLIEPILLSLIYIWFTRKRIFAFFPFVSSLFFFSIKELNQVDRMERN